MITITNQTREFSKIEIYKLTLSPEIVSVKNMPDGEIVEVAGIIEYTDTKDNGQTADIMSFITPDGSVFACQSMTFKRSLRNIADIFTDTDETGSKVVENFSIKKISGTTKSDRVYVDCVLV